MKKHEKDLRKLNKNLIAVFGATGKQGGAVVDALLKEGFMVRAYSRDPNAEEALKLKSRGVEVVKSDMVTDSEDDLKEVLKGCFGAFLVTNYWDPDTKDKEYEIGKKLVDACVSARVPHIVWSGLDNVEKISGGKWKVPHFTLKGKVTEYIENLQGKHHAKFKTYTIAMPAFYFQNFCEYNLCKRDGDTVIFSLPECRFLTAFDVTEFGAAIAQVFQQPDVFDGKRIEYWGEHAPIRSYVDTFQRVTGTKAKFVPISLADCEAALGQEMAHMFGYFNEFGFYGSAGAPLGEFSAQRWTKGGLSNFEAFCKRGGLTLPSQEAAAGSGATEAKEQKEKSGDIKGKERLAERERDSYKAF
jgi:hypothetical protein